MGEHIVADDEIGLPVFRREFLRRLLSEEPHLGSDPVFDGPLRHICRGFDSKDWNPARDEVLQEVSVVAPDLRDQAVGTKMEALRRHVDIALCVRDPAVRVRREVSVLAENGLRGNVFLELHQEALLADVDVQRVERFHLVETLGRNIRFTEGREA